MRRTKQERAKKISSIVRYLRISNKINSSIIEFKNVFMNCTKSELSEALAIFLVERREIIERFKKEHKSKKMQDKFDKYMEESK